MTNEQIRIRIAESLGLFRIMPLKRTTRRGNDYPNGVKLWYCSEHHGGAATYDEVPNYPEDLNAMHEAFKRMDPWLHVQFASNLLGVYRAGNAPSEGAAAVDLLMAEAHHWAEAFLRTLNLWVE